MISTRSKKQAARSPYDRHRGNVKNLLKEIIGAQNKDVERLVQRLEELVKSGQLKTYKAFERTKGKVELLDEDLPPELQDKENAEEEKKEAATSATKPLTAPKPPNQAKPKAKAKAKAKARTTKAKRDVEDLKAEEEQEGRESDWEDVGEEQEA